MKQAAPLGASLNNDSVDFGAFSANAEGIELCLFSSEGEETSRHELERVDGDRWSLRLAGVGSGQRYGYRVHGPWAPDAGHYFNPSKLLIDPYALALTGEPVHDGALDVRGPNGERDTRDSAPFAPRSIVIDPSFEWRADERPGVAWADTVIYECHVRGMTMLHPEVPEELRGTYVGLASEPVVEHLGSLGVTTVELMPVAQSLRERALAERGLSNYFGYNPLAFLAPHRAYATAGGDPVREFKEMVRRFHGAGFEVIVDIVLNHSAEGGPQGPTLSLRGFDNSVYYRLDPDDRSRYRDFTGCGNTLDARQPAVRELFLTTLAYWAEEMHVDGFRFDLAPALAREEAFDPEHELFEEIERHPALSASKLVAEPWDLGPDGYQLGSFPPRWREWNDRFRDPVRRFWRGDATSAEAIQQALSGSPRVFKSPHTSIDFVTCHDGFTLEDLVSYERKHNEANGEANRDGSDHDLSCNWGAEGPTDDPEILAVRQGVKRGLVATLGLTRGVPMLSHGDELGRTQRGNNNAYCHDSDLTWVDWELDETKRKFLDFFRDTLALRRDLSLEGEVSWLSQEGRVLQSPSRVRTPTLALACRSEKIELLALMNASGLPRVWRLPKGSDWDIRLASFTTRREPIRRAAVRVPAHSVLVLERPPTPELDSQVDGAAGTRPPAGGRR